MMCGGQGTCALIPNTPCPPNFDPVCGCDGTTYNNLCEATSAGVNVEFDGMCQMTGGFCGGFAGIPCPPDEYCNYGVGMCMVADASGVCDPMPEICPSVYNPVCGCDGVTYSNACEAAGAGMNVDYSAECTSP